MQPNLNLKFARLRAGLTQIRLAEACGLSGLTPSRISKIEAGYISPYADEIEIIARVLGVKPQRLKPVAGKKALEI